MATHAVWPDRLFVVKPLAHGLQRDCPEAAAYVLEAHLVQATAPVRLEKEPAGHGLGDLHAGGGWVGVGRGGRVGRPSA